MRTIGFSSKVITLATGVLFTCAITGTASAGVNIGVNLNVGPPPIVVPAPPEVVLMPDYGVYFVPGLEFDVFFYNGFWWSPRGDRWYRAQEYNGPWRVIGRRFVPRPVFRVPHDYRGRFERERHIPYGEWREHRGGRHEMRERGEFRERGERREFERGHDRER